MKQKWQLAIERFKEYLTQGMTFKDSVTVAYNAHFTDDDDPTEIYQRTAFRTWARGYYDEWLHHAKQKAKAARTQKSARMKALAAQQSRLQVLEAIALGEEPTSWDEMRKLFAETDGILGEQPDWHLIRLLAALQASWSDNHESLSDIQVICAIANWRGRRKSDTEHSNQDGWEILQHILMEGLSMKVILEPLDIREYDYGDFPLWSS